MLKLLINLLFFSFGFVLVAARHHEKITLRLGHRIALTGICLLFLAGVFGEVMAHQSLATTFLLLNTSNDMHMGVIYGVGAIYLALLCYLWRFSSYLHHARKNSEGYTDWRVGAVLLKHVGLNGVARFFACQRH